jgi:D-alanyl-D-alanine dipeptidase
MRRTSPFIKTLLIMSRSLILILIVVLSNLNFVLAQKYKYGLTPTTFKQYQGSIKTNPQKELVNLEKLIPNIVLDIRYATTNNFTKEKIYNLARAYARTPVAEAVKKAQTELNKQGLGIKIFDGYRPYSATVKFYEVYRDTNFVASPYRGSRHNRGCAVDITLIDLKTKQELKMPTPYDTFVKEARPTYPVKDAEAKKNRELLISVMSKYGFKVNASEWWHFDFIGYKNYEVLDIDFEELE